MGGTGLLIYGTLTPERLAPRPVRRTLTDRLLGRTREVGPRVTKTGRGGLVELDPSELAPLLARYREYLARQLPQPSHASRQVLEYLQLGHIPSLYVRGEREMGKEPEWYTQLGFSGCAGMAEVAALVACHWAAAWVRDELPLLEREIFTPFGFTPRPGQAFGWSDIFLPVAGLGYLRYVPEDERDSDGLAFEADHAVLEGDQGAEASIVEAGVRYSGVAADGRCRCQLCAPAFATLT